MTRNTNAPGIWVGQTLHFASLTLLLTLVWFAWNQLGRPLPMAFWAAVAFPVVHQIYVWMSWRMELGSEAISRSVGFRCYVVVFLILFVGRFASLAVLGWLDRDSLKLPIVAQTVITIILAVPALYAGYSVQRYFGILRATGADHFDPCYRDMPLVKQGIFRFTNNGMYFYVFLSFWAIATGLNSKAALVVSAFAHLYIWIHFYATEKPDMEFLYAKEDVSA